MSELLLPPRLHALALAALFLGVATASTGQTSPPEETLEAREQARLCERLDEEEGIAACRAALALGLGPERRGPVREILARHLVDLERWGELAEHYREDVRLSPEDAEPWRRLGAILLFALNQRVEALAAFEEAARLDPTDAPTQCLLAIALHSLGRFVEATKAFDDALRLDPGILDNRPAARRVREAARRGEPWP
jgi:tetratricopeptide (TPR) repeat protein